MKMAAKLFFIRVRGLLRKEFLQIGRDPSSIALAIVMPIILLFIFGYGLTLDADHIPVTITADDQSPAVRELSARFTLSPHFSVIPTANKEEAKVLLDDHRIDAIIHLPGNFTKLIEAGESAPMQLLINGIDANRARLIRGYMQYVLGIWATTRQNRGEAVQIPPVTLVSRIWFNETAESTSFLVPGLITLIMTLTGILLTALVIAREWERGTMEAILATPVRRIEFLLGKIIPYYLLGMVGLALSIIVAILVFDVPVRGSLALLFLLSSLFMLACLGLGLLLSASIKIQFVAAQVSILIGFLPAFFLSGLIFDLESTPKVIQLLSYIVPARYFITISHTLFMAGNIRQILLPNGLILAGMAFFFILVAYKKTSKRLEG